MCYFFTYYKCQHVAMLAPTAYLANQSVNTHKTSAPNLSDVEPQTPTHLAIHIISVFFLICILFFCYSISLWLWGRSWSGLIYGWGVHRVHFKTNRCRCVSAQHRAGHLYVRQQTRKRVHLTCAYRLFFFLINPKCFTCSWVLSCFSSQTESTVVCTQVCMHYSVFSVVWCGEG